MNSTSSWSFEGQDIIASSLLRNIDSGFYFDIGCASPTEISNTWLFYQQGWRGLAVDGRPLHNEWETSRPRDVFVQELVGDGSETVFVQFPDPHMNSCDSSTISRYSERFSDGLITSRKSSTVQAGSIWDAIFPAVVPDLVSIDVEGYELEVLRGFDLAEKRPKLFIIELKNFNFMAPRSLPVVSYLYENRYSLVAKTPLDGFFIDVRQPDFDWIPRAML
jgi:FkbM family methyltransferase